MNPGDTGAERATTVKSNQWTNLVIIATLTDETTFTDGLDYQNTTFTVNEIVYQRNPDSPLENYVDVQQDGTMLVHKTTMTCVCGRELSVEDIGSDYLLEISEYGDSFSACSASCRYSDSRSDVPELCHDTAAELRASSTLKRNIPKLGMYVSIVLAVWALIIV